MHEHLSESPQEKGPEQQRLEAIIVAALDRYVNDREIWLAARHGFYTALEYGAEVHEAVEYALDWAELGSKATMVVDVLDLSRERIDISHISFASLEQEASYHRTGQSEDTILTDQARGVYGVFDGMGAQGGNPRAASQAAAEAVRSYFEQQPEPETKEALLQQMKESFEEARFAVRSEGEQGSTVATGIKLAIIDGEHVCGVGHAGDTRFFIYSPDTMEFKAITTDQSMGKYVFNGFSPESDSPTSDEYMVVPLKRGDRLMLCSDGITGDYEKQFLSREEMLACFDANTTDECASRFMEISKKDDDKSVIVIDI